MKEAKEGKKSTFTRRDFIKVTGIALASAAGVAGAIGAWEYFEMVNKFTPPPVDLSLSKGVIQVNPEYCAGCRTCESVCALHHEGESQPELSRIQSEEDQFKLVGMAPSTCKQCEQPQCLRYCPRWGKAIHVDEETGARVIDEGECVGCQTCIARCPYDPPGPRYDWEKHKSIKCDLCGGDPQCVEFCPGGALTYYYDEDGVRTGYPSEIAL